MFSITNTKCPLDTGHPARDFIKSETMSTCSIIKHYSSCKKMCSLSWCNHWSGGEAQCKKQCRDRKNRKKIENFCCDSNNK